MNKHKWSKKYDKCQECATTEKKHMGLGLCKPCYNNQPKFVEGRKLHKKSPEYKARQKVYQKKYMQAYYPSHKDTLNWRISSLNKSSKRRAIYKKTDITSPWLKWLYETTEYCIYCGVKMTENGREQTGKTLDHIKPISRNGWHVMANVRVICLACNMDKRALEEAEHWERNVFQGVHVEAIIDKTIIISL